MTLQPSTILGLGLCLGLLTSVEMQMVTYPTPFLRAEPGSEVLQGQSVTLVCWSTEGVDSFRLEKAENSSHLDEKPTKGGTKAEFLIQTVGKDSAGSYRCLYHRQNKWSGRSEPLKLVVIEDTSTRPSGDTPTHTEPSDLQHRISAPGTGFGVSAGVDPTSPQGLGVTAHRPSDPTPGLPPEHVYILAGVSGTSVLLLLLLLLLLFHRRNRTKQGPPSHAGKEERLEERVSPLATVPDTTGAVTVDGLLVQDGVLPSSLPDAGDPPEVTYAKLNRQRLTWGAAPTRSPQPPKSESSMYATLARH